MSRRSEISSKSNKVDFNLSLFEHALKDPASKNLILQLLSANQKNVFELFKPVAGDSLNSPVRRVKKKEHCESPTALLRRRELEKKNRPERPESALSHTSEQSSTSGRSSSVPFEDILKNVVAYVEINSNGNDRSGGAKALLRSMGATVCEKFSRDVTHVIFKDGSYTTYQRAKLLKVHLVSVLWLEATRRNGVRALEKNYPALGTKNYDLNVSMICSQMQKDYEDVIRDEIRKTLESGTPLPSTKTLIDNRRRTVGSSSKSFDTSSQLVQSFANKDFNNTVLSRIGGQSTSKNSQPSSMILQDDSPAVSTDEDLSTLSRRIQDDILNSSSDSFRPTSLGLGGNRRSDSASECGMIDGDFSQKDSIVDDTFKAIEPLQSDEVFSSNMEITCNEDRDCEMTPSDNRNRTSNVTTSMDLTTPTAGSILRTLKGSLMNSLSYLTSRNETLTISSKRTNNEKENISVPSPNNTPKMTKRRSVQTKSTIKKKTNVELDPVSTPTLDSENAMCQEDFYSLKTPKLGKVNVKKPVNLLTEANCDMISEEDSGTVMSSLRISGDSKGKTSSAKNSIENQKSAENSKKSTGSSMSSLRLSKSSSVNESMPDVSTLNISSSKETNKEGIINEEIQNVSNPIPLSSTPFVTDRKKRNNRKSVRTELFSVLDDSSTSTTPLRRSKRESSMMKKEKEEFKKELEKKGTSHDRNKEVELVASKEEAESTPRPARKFPSKTPRKSDVFLSPFVNTRPRRKSTARALEVVDSREDSENKDRRSTRRSSRIDREQIDCTPKKVEEESVSDKLTLFGVHEESPEDQSEAQELSNIMEEDEHSEQNDHSNNSRKSVVHLQDTLVSPPGDMKPIGKRKSTTTLNQDECVVSLVSMSNDDTEESPPKRIKTEKKSSSEEKMSISRRTKSVLTERDAEKEKQETNEMKTERKSRRTTCRKPSETISEQNESSTSTKKRIEETNTRINENNRKKMSRSKSESDVRSSTRKSRRIRKLYDPDQCDAEEEIQERLGVNDQEERKTKRQENVTKVNIKSQHTWLNGNMLMTQKALEFLERTQDKTATLFKEPEAVLEQLGINKERRRGNDKNKKKESILDRSDDEQVDLADEFVHKKGRKVFEESQVPQKTPRTQKSSRTLTQRALTTGNGKRRSTMEFAPKALSMPKARIKLNLDQKPTIVCTKMHKSEVQMFNQIVKKLGRFEVENEVSPRTTHLVVGESKRTVNMLRALSRGCWILRHEWLLSSLENDAWLPEEKYEATEFSPAVKQCRLRRQAFGPSYHMNIFLDCGSIYVAKSTIPRCSDIRELITVCEGKVTKNPDNAKIAVGVYLAGCDCVNEYWVLDSITSGKLEPMEDYIITADSAKTKSPFV